MTTGPIVRAVDVGYGNTKATLSSSADGRVECLCFPSLTPRAQAAFLDGGLLRKRNTVTIEVDGQRFEIGPDAHFAQEDRTGRNLSDRYVDDPAYLALLRGALAYMKVDRIDLLALGLPVAVMRAKADALKKLAVGEHPVDDGRIVLVCDALVIAQPLGGLIHYAATGERFTTFKHQTNLIIDVGFLTVDWVLSKRFEVVRHRSGGTNAGVARLLVELADHVSQELGHEVSNLNELDDAVRQACLKIHGRQYSIEPLLAKTQQTIREAVRDVSASIQTDHDLDNVIISGGGARLYREAIEQRFNDCACGVFVAPDSLYANVRGFQMFAENEMRRRRMP